MKILFSTIEHAAAIYKRKTLLFKFFVIDKVGHAVDVFGDVP